MGKLSDADLQLVIETLKKAYTIKGKTKKKFGLFDSHDF